MLLYLYPMMQTYFIVIIEYRYWDLGNYRSGINSFCHKMSGNTVFFVS